MHSNQVEYNDGKSVETAVNELYEKADELGKTTEKYEMKKIGCEGCTKLEYLESTRKQYIDTGIKSNINLKFNFVFESKEYDDNPLFGGRSDYNSELLIDFYDDGSTYGIFVRFGPFNNILIGGLKLNNKYRIVLSKDGVYLDDNKVSDAFQYGFVDVEHSVTLFAFRNFKNGSIIRYGSFKLYNTMIYDDNTLVRDYIPVLDSNDRPCLFDKVSKTCFYNQGTGEFLYE